MKDIIKRLELLFTAEVQSEGKLAKETSTPNEALLFCKHFTLFHTLPTQASATFCSHLASLPGTNSEVSLTDAKEQTLSSQL